MLELRFNRRVFVTLEGLSFSSLMVWNGFGLSLLRRSGSAVGSLTPCFLARDFSGDSFMINCCCIFCCSIAILCPFSSVNNFCSRVLGISVFRDVWPLKVDTSAGSFLLKYPVLKKANNNIII